MTLECRRWLTSQRPWFDGWKKDVMLLKRPLSWACACLLGPPWIWQRGLFWFRLVSRTFKGNRKHTNQEGRHPKDHVADVVGIGDVSRHHHLTGADGEVQTPQDPGKNLKRYEKKNNKTLGCNIGCSVIATCYLCLLTNWRVYFCLLHITTFLNSIVLKVSLLKQKQVTSLCWHSQGKMIFCFSTGLWNAHHRPRFQGSGQTWKLQSSKRDSNLIMKYMA